MAMNALKDSLRKVRDRLFSFYEASRLKNKSYVLVTNNCWGYELYNSTGREYNTPFIGLFLHPECYVRLLENFEHCLTAEMEFRQQSKYYAEPKSYPIGVIKGDIEVHFLHYKSQAEAREKWQRRVFRFKNAVASGAEIYFKLCDCEGCSPEHLARFHALPFQNKISIGLQRFNNPNHIHVPKLQNSSGSALVDGARLFKKRYTYFDITHWLLQGDIVKTSVSRIFSLLR
jgi:uncharacterized protein (DUF1919 family)